MATTVQHRTHIPDAPWYVLSTDTFMSGWGPATGRTNRLILPCESREEAEDVAAYARSRTDTKDVEIVSEKPYLHRPLYRGSLDGVPVGPLWQVMDPDDSSAWYRLRDGGAA